MNKTDWLETAKLVALREFGEGVCNAFFYNVLCEFYDPDISPELGVFRVARFLERESPMLATLEGVLVDEM